MVLIAVWKLVEVAQEAVGQVELAPTPQVGPFAGGQVVTRMGTEVVKV